MPQLSLEFTDNIFEKETVSSVFEKCHTMLVQSLPTKLADCKSRAILRNQYCVGDGEPKNAFIHVSLKVMPGRTAETLKNVGDQMIEILKDHFSESFLKLKLQITVEISEFQNYFKVSG